MIVGAALHLPHVIPAKAGISHRAAALHPEFFGIM